MTVQHRSRVVDKPWGHEEIFAQTPHYVGKILFIKQGEALSLQYHEVKEETLRVLDGELELMIGAGADAIEDYFSVAAAQVDVHEQVIVIDLSDSQAEAVCLVNPEILEKEGSINSEEGCLSVPEFF